MRSIRFFILALFVVSPIAIAGSGTGTDTKPTPQADSGLVSIFAGQSALLNVANVGDPAKSCSFTMTFIDSSGAVVTPVKSTTPAVDGGKSDFLLYTPSSPIQVRAHLDFTSQLASNFDQKDPMDGCYKLAPTLEVMDATETKALNTAFYGMPSFKDGEKMSKVDVCHKLGTPAQKTLTVAMSALKGHLGHGDTVGACPAQ